MDNKGKGKMLECNHKCLRNEEAPDKRKGKVGKRHWGTENKAWNAGGREEGIGCCYWN